VYKPAPGSDKLLRLHATQAIDYLGERGGRSDMWERIGKITRKDFF
jgi:hypothetical protein